MFSACSVKSASRVLTRKNLLRSTFSLAVNPQDFTGSCELPENSTLTWKRRMIGLTAGECPADKLRLMAQLLDALAHTADIGVIVGEQIGRKRNGVFAPILGHRRLDLVLLGGVVLGFPQYLDFYCVSDILLLLLYCIVVSLGGVLWIIML